MAYKVVDADQLDADLTAVADAIREKTGGSELLSFPDGMVAEVGAVYEAGEQAGRQAEYDAFWDTFQQNGNRNYYRYAFGTSGWTGDNFYPKYDIILKTSYATYAFFNSSQLTIDLVERMNDLGIKFVFDNFTNAAEIFCNSGITHLGELDFSAVTTGYGAFFGAANLTTIDKLIVSEATDFDSVFYACRALENLIIDGTIGQNEFNVRHSPLNKASLTSIINALSDTTTDLTVTLSLTAVNNAFETSEGAADGSTSEEWLALVETKSNWTISLA